MGPSKCALSWLLLLAAAGIVLSTREQRAVPRRPRPTSATAPPALVDGLGSPLDCPCNATPEYNPVCGTNGATYGSPVKLRCAQSCGHKVQLSHYGTCKPVV